MEKVDHDFKLGLRVTIFPPGNPIMKRLIVNGAELAVSDSGQGWPLILVHGFPFDHTMWESMNFELQEKSTLSGRSGQYRIIVPDLRGFGQSGGADTPGSCVSMEQHADDIAGLLYSLQISEKIVLCGLSMGGYVTMAFAKKYAAKLSGIILCDTRSAADPPEAARNRRRLADELDAGTCSLEAVAVDMLPKLLTPETINNTPQTVRVATKMMTGHPVHGVAASARGMADRPDSTEMLDSLNLPILVLRGSDDTISPRDDMESIAKRAKRGTYVEIDGAGHLGPMERPSGYAAAILEFIDTL